MVLLFRGAWCPYRTTQLSAFQRATDRLADVDARVVALSTDDVLSPERAAQAAA